MITFIKATLKLIVSFSIICGCLWLGEYLESTFNLFFPGCIVGFFILLLLLCLKIVPEKFFAPAANIALNNMVFLFVPVTVGVIEHYSLFKRHIFEFIISCLASTCIVLLVAYFIYLVAFSSDE